MKVSIPKEFKIGPYKINVSKKSDLAYREGAVGMAYFNTCEIGLQQSEQGYPVSGDQVLVTFLHELMHWVFYMVERRDLCEDERLVEACAKQLCQVVQTAKGKEITINVGI